ncbi:aminotransferase class V-fold PLP-dependent enzyme [Nocardia zapadnayensis]|uniref:O-acetylhomoserine aminocarboxypropyltransferase/cysteine synthase family protein n=1 Tax=uncultured Brevibacterium sp. TaxID=189678 RepID=UPI002246230B|nr:aminotransferase class V-fold PLP-dependent enzyme [Nocardia zapadnayensis]MCX0277441.1 aminotransferase class V-fold PLP-dependent enzyme [Nocardia zapadnayensis]
MSAIARAGSENTPAGAGLAPATRQIHVGYTPGTPQNTVAVPIYQSAAYEFESFAAARDTFALRRPGNIYSRNGNPTNAVLERRVADLEGGAGAVALGSGQAAVAVALLTLVAAAGPGSARGPGMPHHIVASNKLYGGTSDLLGDTFADLGIEVTFVDPLDLAAWEAALRETTRAVFLESIGNPILTVPDIAAIADLAHSRGVPVVIDNTMATPVLLRPIELGADIVVHSATKYLGGHGTSIAGVIVDAGTFDFTAEAPRWPRLTRPYHRFGDIVFTEEFDGSGGRTPFLVLARAKAVHDLGPTLSPFNAAQIIQGIETLELRIRRQTQTAFELAEFLVEQPQVARVHHPGLPGHPEHALAGRLLPEGLGSVFAFDLAVDPVQVETFVDALELFALVANIGDTRSLVVHPATMTHSRLDEAGRAGAGIDLTTVRLSIGLEDPADLRRDLAAALAALTPAAAASATDHSPALAH